jgi:simple sugar transport system substrate-binding protein
LIQGVGNVPTTPCTNQFIVAGSFKPFAAPLADNEGHVRLTQGALDDAAIATMNWFVQGVVGTLPTP